MKKQLILLASILIILSACGNNSGSESRSSEMTYPEPVYAKERVKFDGHFSGNANNTNFRLDVTNTDGVVSGTMKDGENSFLLSGVVSGERVTGTMKYILGDMPFEAYYQGPSLIMQLDEETINAFKILLAAASDDAAILLAESKIVFDEE